MYFLPEEFWLILMSNWWVIVYSFLHPINMSSTLRHKFYWFWLILIDFVRVFVPLFDLNLLFFKPLWLWSKKRYQETVNGDLPDFCCSFKFGNKKKHFICTLRERQMTKIVRFFIQVWNLVYWYLLWHKTHSDIVPMDIGAGSIEIPAFFLGGGLACAEFPRGVEFRGSFAPFFFSTSLKKNILNNTKYYISAKFHACMTNRTILPNFCHLPFHYNNRNSRRMCLRLCPKEGFEAVRIMIANDSRKRSTPAIIAIMWRPNHTWTAWKTCSHTCTCDPYDLYENQEAKGTFNLLKNHILLVIITP